MRAQYFSLQERVGSTAFHHCVANRVARVKYAPAIAVNAVMLMGGASAFDVGKDGNRFYITACFIWVNFILGTY